MLIISPIFFSCPTAIGSLPKLNSMEKNVVDVKPKFYSFATFPMKISSAYLATTLSHPDHMEPRNFFL